MMIMSFLSHNDVEFYDYHISNNDYDNYNFKKIIVLTMITIMKLLV